MLALPLTGVAAVAENVLFDFGPAFDLKGVRSTDVRLAPVRDGARRALRIDSFHNDPWPGVTLKAPKDHWDLSAFSSILVDVRNVGNNPVNVHCRVDNPGADGTNDCVTRSIALEPGQAGTLRVEMVRKSPPGISLFGMNGFPAGIGGGKSSIDPARVNQLIIFLAEPKEDHSFTIARIRAAGKVSRVPSANRFMPFIDEYGQYIHADWPGKTKGPADLARRRKAEERDLETRPGPKGWDRYGGWEDGPKLPATGWFRVVRYEGKWWLVDPNGRLFFSQGVDCVNAWEGTPVDGREKWFRKFPGGEPRFKGFWGETDHVVRGDYQGRNPRWFDFSQANLLRKYGKDWYRIFGDKAHRRLRSWGFNTIGNWSDGGIFLPGRTPYVTGAWYASPALRGSVGYWGQFPDVFDAKFTLAIREAMARVAEKTANDPWCIGYFIDNELSWGHDTSLALSALASPADQPAKLAMVDGLKARYGRVGELNRAWRTDYASWEALLSSTTAVDSAGARPDLRAFNVRFADRYFETCRDAVRAAAPAHLYLGCRFGGGWLNDVAVASATRYCDVVSFNLYQPSVASFSLGGALDAPVIIGEFHFGALDRGPFHTGLVPVADQAARAKAFKDYVTGALRNPLFVGAHWFQFMDEATTGRPLDGENYQIGLVDIVDTPYPETVAAAREVGRDLYAIRAGK